MNHTRKILITGASGMVGLNLLENNHSSKYELLTPERAVLDLLKRDSIEVYLDKHNPDMIIHCAGLVGGIEENMSNMAEFLIVNLDIGKNLVLAAKRSGIKRMINLGSSCMYPRDAENPLKEEMILKGELEPTNEGYALAKIAVAKLCEYVSKDDVGYSYKTIIPCNLYGRWDKFSPERSHMIPGVSNYRD